jgi:DNA-binding response OmpR family regulator
MEIMVIDRDVLTNQLIASKLEAKGHRVQTFQNKNEAFDVLRTGAFDCVMVDPAPLSEPKPVIVAVWRNIRTEIKPYVVLLTKTATTEDAILAGANDMLTKPLDTQEIEARLANAERLIEISRHLAHEDHVHSSHGMIGKAAFNQLYLAAVDRAVRYGERSLIVFIHFRNYDTMLETQGDKEVGVVIRKLSERMTFMRRQSDVIGRLGVKDFAILLQRPQSDTEPAEAMQRFTDHLDKFYHSQTDKDLAPEMELHLVEVPQGALHMETAVPQKTDV